MPRKGHVAKRDVLAPDVVALVTGNGGLLLGILSLLKRRKM